MDVFLQEFTQIIKITAIGTGILILIGLFIFTINKLLKKDLSDQTGWKNFARPLVGILFVSVSLQLIVIVVATLSIS